MSRNNDLRADAALADVRWWEIAERLGMVDSCLSRKLRKELPQEE